MAKKSTHNKRIINAEIFVYSSLISAFLLLIIINLFSYELFKISSLPNIPKKILFSPFDVSTHLALANNYLKSNLKASEKEYLIAEDIYQHTAVNKNVLGIESNPLNIWKKVLTKKEEILKELDYWKKIYSEFPDYTFGAIKIASLYKQLGENNLQLKTLTSQNLKTPYDFRLNKMIQELNSN